ncbi:Cyanovirin-N, partial [Trichophaea hybrida]
VSFHLSSQESTLRIDEGRYLRGVLYDANGNPSDSEIDLDAVLGNDNGYFQWDGEGFSGSAQNVTFSIEGGGQVPVLRALLCNEDGEYVPADVNLSERIENQNGQFTFSK